MRYSIVVRSYEWSSNFQEIIEFSVGINCRSSGFGSQSSETVAIDLHHSIVGDLGTFSGSLLFFLNSRVEVIGQLVFEWQLAAGSDCLIFSLLLKGSMSNFKYTDWPLHKL